MHNGWRIFKRDIDIPIGYAGSRVEIGSKTVY